MLCAHQVDTNGDQRQNEDQQSEQLAPAQDVCTERGEDLIRQISPQYDVPQS